MDAWKTWPKTEDLPTFMNRVKSAVIALIKSYHVEINHKLQEIEEVLEAAQTAADHYEDIEEDLTDNDNSKKLKNFENYIKLALFQNIHFHDFITKFDTL